MHVSYPIRSKTVKEQAERIISHLAAAKCSAVIPCGSLADTSAPRWMASSTSYAWPHLAASRASSVRFPCMLVCFFLQQIWLYPGQEILCNSKSWWTQISALKKPQGKLELTPCMKIIRNYTISMAFTSSSPPSRISSVAVFDHPPGRKKHPGKLHC